MARKGAKEAAKKKAAKQKKILIFLVLVLAAVLGFAAMTLMKGKSSPAAAVTPPTGTTPSGSDPATGTPVAVVTPISPGIAAPPAGSLGSFTAFERKDPFFDDGPDLSAKSSSSTPTSNPPIADAAPPPSTPTKTTTPKSSSGSPSGAVIAVNGKKFTVALGGKFGQRSCSCGGALFKLADVSAKTAVIVIVGSTQHWALYLGQPLRLEQQGGGEYKVTFLKVERS